MASARDPYCPALHLLVAALPEQSSVVAVVGEVGASKSHLVAALFAEALHGPHLERLGLLAETRPSQRDVIESALRTVYTEGSPLPATPAEAIPEPWILRLSDESGRQRNLVFYDVGGEVARDMGRVAASARHVFSAATTLFVLDPETVASSSPFQAKGQAISPSDFITSYADAVGYVLGQQGGEIAQPFVVVVGKADLVEWGDVHWPPLTRPASLDDFRREASEISDEVRCHLAEAGLRSVVRVAERRFAPGCVSFSRLSSTSVALPAQDVDLVRPEGAWHPVFLILNAIAAFGW